MSRGSMDDEKDSAPEPYLPPTNFSFQSSCDTARIEPLETPMENLHEPIFIPLQMHPSTFVGRFAGGLTRLVYGDPASNAPVVVEEQVLDEEEVGALNHQQALECRPEGPQGDLTVDLDKAIDGFLQVQNDAATHIVMAAIAARDLLNHPITAHELQLASPSPFLVRQLLTSGALDCADEPTKVELQQLLDRLIVPNRDYRNRVDPRLYDDIEAMLRLPTVKLTCKQHHLMRRSGYEFVKLLRDHPHVVSGLPKPLYFKFRRVVCAANIWLAFLIVLLEVFDTFSIILCTVYWFSQTNNFGGIYTLITIACSFAVNWCAMSIIQKTYNFQSIRYRHALGPIPSVMYTSVPLFPVYDVALLSSFVRHHYHEKSDEHLLIKHELLATLRVSVIVRALAYSFPCLLMETYLFDWTFSDDISSSSVGYTLLQVSTSLVLLVAVSQYLISVGLFDSVNNFGFAVYGSQAHTAIVQHNTWYPRVFYLCGIFLLELFAFFILLGSINHQNCYFEMVVSNTTMAIATASLLCMYGCLLWTKLGVFRCGFFVIPLVASQIIFLVLIPEYSPKREISACEVFEQMTATQLVPAIVLWCCTLVVICVWIALGIWNFFFGGNEEYDL